MGEEVRVVTWQEGHDRPMRPDVAIVRQIGSGGSQTAGGRHGGHARADRDPLRRGS